MIGWLRLKMWLRTVGRCPHLHCFIAPGPAQYTCIECRQFVGEHHAMTMAYEGKPPLSDYMERMPVPAPGHERVVNLTDARIVGCSCGAQCPAGLTVLSWPRSDQDWFDDHCRS